MSEEEQKHLMQSYYDLHEKYYKLQNQLQQKENIIKEVRKYKNNLLFDLNRGKEFEKWEEILNPIDEILDKENKDIELDMLKALNTDLDDDVEMG